MGLNYDKYKQEEESKGSFWTSYSDLFMIMAFVFLLLYVLTVLKSSTGAVVNHSKFQELKKENESLKDQLRAYEILKDDYVSNSASKSEKDEYQKLMSQLELLQENTDKENDKLQAEIQKNQLKKTALNDYQKVIKSIIEANYVAKSRVDRRDKLIGQQDGELNRQLSMLQEKKQVLAQSKSHIEDLQENIKNKELDLKKTDIEVSKLKESLNTKIASIQQLKIKGDLTQKEMTAQIEELKEKNKKTVDTLLAKSVSVQDELNRKVSDLAREKSAQAKLVADLASQKALLEKEFQDAQGQFKEQEKALLSTVASQKASFEQIKQGLESENKNLGKDVARLTELVQAKKNLAKKLQAAFKGKNIQASVDQETGDVEINFGDEYFDVGKSDLKKGMMDIVQKLIPEYASVLYKDPEVVRKIKSVEIVGFASPTYQGKVINPKSLDPSHRKAVNYNLDLSYFRAKSIFKYVFNKNLMQFPEQKQLLDHIKVSGRSFFTEDSDGRSIASTDIKDYCKDDNCLKSQKVIIKFSMD